MFDGDAYTGAVSTVKHRRPATIGSPCFVGAPRRLAFPRPGRPKRYLRVMNVDRAPLRGADSRARADVRLRAVRVSQ